MKKNGKIVMLREKNGKIGMLCIRNGKSLNVNVKKRWMEGKFLQCYVRKMKNEGKDKKKWRNERKKYYS